jgi:hypothetical protein
MSTAPGLRRFVRPAAPPARRPGGPQTGGGQASPAPGLAPPADVGDAAPTSAEAAMAGMPPLVAELLAAAPAPDVAPAPAERAGIPSRAQASRSPAPDDEACEMCAAPVPAEHGHVADLESSSLACACRACYLLFTQPTAGRGRYRAVPDRYLSDPARPLPAARWDELEIPVGLAFFLASSRAGRVGAFYPSPAGVTECELNLDAWQRLGADYPLLARAAPDGEAVLISRTPAGVEAFVVPVDVCYELAGRMRLQWRGFDGGAEARASIAEFLDRARDRARPLGPGA